MKEGGKGRRQRDSSSGADLFASATRLRVCLACGSTSSEWRPRTRAAGRASQKAAGKQAPVPPPAVCDGWVG